MGFIIASFIEAGSKTELCEIQLLQEQNAWRKSAEN